MSYTLGVSPFKSSFIITGLTVQFLLCMSVSYSAAVPSILESQVQSIGKLIEQAEISQAQTVVDQFWAEYSDEEGFVDAARRIKDQYWMNGGYAEHFILCERIVQAFPTDPLSIGIQVDQVTGYIKLKDMTKAAAKLEQFWRRYSSDERFVDFARQIKDQYWRDGYYAEHFNLCERLVREFPDNPLAMAVYADDITGYIRTKDTQKAAAQLDSFWTHYGTKEGFTTHLRNIKNVYWSDGYIEAHDALCDRILQAFPNDPVTFEIVAGEISEQIHEKNTIQASQDLEQFWTAHKADPGFVNAVRQIKDAYWQDGYYAEHFDLCERIVRDFPDNPLSIGIQADQVTGYIKVKNMNKATEELEQFWTGYSADDRFVDYAGRIKDQFWASGKYADHFDLCERIVNEFPNAPLSIGIQVDQVTGHLKLNDMAKASEKLEQFWTQFSSNEEFVKRAHELGWAFVMHKDFETAIRIYTKLKDQFSTHERAPWFQRSIIQAYLEKGDMVKVAEAVEELKTNYRQCTDYSNQMYETAICLYDKNHYALAVGIYDCLLRDYPDSRQAVNIKRLKIQSLLKMNKLIEAGAELEGMSAYTDRPEYLQQMYEISKAFMEAGYREKGIELYRSIAETFHNTEYGLICQGALIIHDIQRKDKHAAQAQYTQMLSNFAVHPMLSREIYHVAGVYAVHGQTDKAIALHRYNVQQHGETDYGRWSNVELILNLIRNKDYDAAQEECGVFLNRYPADPTLGKELYILAREFVKAGDRDRGFQLHLDNVRHAKECDHTRWSNVEVVYYYIDKGDFENAKSACLSFVKRYADHPDLGKELGNILNRYAASGNMAQAEGLCQSVLQAYPNNPKVIWMQSGLAGVYLDQMADSEADAAFEKLLVDYAGNPELNAAVKNLGRYCADKYSDAGKAVQFYSRFLDRYSSHPNAVEIETERIGVYIDLKAADQADAAIRSLALKNPNNPNMAQLINEFADHCRGAELYHKAIDLNQMVLARNPAADRQLDAYAGMAKAAARLQGAAVDPNGPSLSGLDVDAIVRRLMTDYKDMPRLGFHVFQIGEEYYFRAEESINRGNKELAQPDFQQALTIWQKNINEIADMHHQCLAYYYSATVYRHLGEYEKAIVLFQKVADQRPENNDVGNAQFLVAWCYDKMCSEGIKSKDQVRSLILDICHKIQTDTPGSPAIEGVNLLEQKYRSVISQ